MAMLFENGTMLATANIPEPWSGNSTTNEILTDLMDSNFLKLLGSLIFAFAWVIYITYYNSRIVGCIITKVVNRFLAQRACFQIGSFTLNALSGKIMFRDVVYANHDCTLRVQDGYVIFRWWRAYVPKDVSEDLSHSDTRLSVVLNGFELHVYNRSDLYAHVERIFGLEPAIYPDNNNDERAGNAEDGGKRRHRERKQRSEAAMARTWRDLIPVIKIDVSSGRLVFGNRLVPSTLSITVEESHFVYSTRPAVNNLDRFMHFSKGKAENARVMLAPSLKYTGMSDEPPRYMGEGFVLMSTNDLELYFYMDEPGVVPEQPATVILLNGDVVESAPPQWGVDIKCGKSTNFSYGPWADRQREHLFKFFYPQDYQPMSATAAPLPGDKRQMQSFDVRLSMLSEARVDILFSTCGETNAVHVAVGAGSYLEITIPWVTRHDGYATRVNGQLLHLEATTSLPYRELIVSETLEFAVTCHYPLAWNAHQLWELQLTGCKATLSLLFGHKCFFQDFVNDWSSKARPDILHFVPYTWRLGVTLKHCEIITMVNQHNWVDCDSVGQKHHLENTRIALCAHFMHLSFDLPFSDFLPDTVTLNFGVQGESIDLSLFVPAFHTSRDIVGALDAHAKIRAKDGGATKKAEAIPKWRDVCQKSAGWTDFWWIPIGAINIAYTYHPCPPLGPAPQADISTPIKEEILLSPIRFPYERKRKQRSPEGVQRFDPTTLKADVVAVELEVGPSVLLLYGTALRNFLNFKENIFGEDQHFTDLQGGVPDAGGGNGSESGSIVAVPLEQRDDFDRRTYRPLDVDLSIVMHDIQAHLLKNCTPKDPACPVVLVERFGFEMKKRYDQTELQLLLSPAVLLVDDAVARVSKDRHLRQGRMTLSSLQIRGHAMFSDVGRALDQDTIEHAWLVEIQLGKLSGKLTTPQLYALLACMETLVLLLADAENALSSPMEDTLLSEPPVQTNAAAPPHFQQRLQAVQQLLQPKSSSASASDKAAASREKQQQQQQRKSEEKRERRGGALVGESSPIEEINERSHQLKYKFTRVAVDAVDFWLVESGAALQLWMSPIRLSTCNLHGKQVGSGLTCVVYGTSLRQCVWQPQKYNHSKSHSDEQWLEVGSVDFAPVVIEAAMCDAHKDDGHALQQKFLKTHDEKLKKLWFLWPDSNQPTTTASSCGCTGGCRFFGKNANGRRFFRPARRDLRDGTNVAAFRVNEPGDDPAYGQSILHDGMLIFRTPPYTVNAISLQEDAVSARKRPESTITSDVRFNTLPQPAEKRAEDAVASPQSLSERRSRNARRYSSTSIRSRERDVPYARLVDAKLDSDSKLHRDKCKLAVAGDVPEEGGPKNSASDSKLAVDYGKGVDASESQHSLSARVLSDERLPKDVQRTFSISSENHSEVFFSADEDVNVNSRSSSLRNSMLSANGTLTMTRQETKRFASEQSIANGGSSAQPRRQVAAAASIVTTPSSVQSARKLSTHRSDHEIHTPEHRSSVVQQGLVTPQRHPSIVRNASPRLTLHECSDALFDDEDESSKSCSSNSYVSAVGSQEDFTLVDLHMQVNRLIFDSPMLMSSYVMHLSQLRCANWPPSDAIDACTPPLFQRCADEEGSHLVYVGGRFVPRMDTIAEGVTALKMVARSTSAVASEWDYCTDTEHDDDEQQEADDADGEEELLGCQHNAGARTSIIVKVRGDVDVMVTPLLLESLQRFVDALTPTVSALHPLTVVNHLHACCIGQVEAANTLKTTANIALLRDAGGSFETTIKTQLQAAVLLPNVNVMMLQASIVEEIISFSALDNIKDLTCVSTFSVCFESVAMRLHVDKQARQLLQKFYRPAVVPSDGKKGGKKHFLSLHSSTHADVIRGEPVLIESCERQQRQLVVSLSVGKTHAQLRRLRNECSVLDDAVITAIPTHCSKVLFTSRRRARPRYRGVDFYLPPPAGGVSAQEDQADDEDKLGFIIFECGLEGVSLKLVKKSREEDSSKECAPEERDGENGEDVEGAEGNGDQQGVQEADAGNVSSCVIELKVVWFNFAAPPKTPITRKIDYTRLDWNLLSTASPAINAWMNPSNRLAIRVVHLVRAMYRRSTATIACLMTEALEVPSLHVAAKSRYGKLTPLSTTLHEDPSCRLCGILQKYYLHADAGAVEGNLRENEMPQLFTLRQGVIALSRNWKSQLHTPLMHQNSTKQCKVKALNVLMQMPTVEEVYLTDGEGSGLDDHDITDEHAQLLHSGIILKPGKTGKEFSPPDVSTPKLHVYDASPGAVQINYACMESSMTSPSSPGYGTLREDRTVVNMGSNPSVGTHSTPELATSPSNHHKAEANDSSEDLYSWMARQNNEGFMRSTAMDPRINTLHTESTDDELNNGGAGGGNTASGGGGGNAGSHSYPVNLYAIHDSVRFEDANIIFQPLLSSLGVMPHQLKVASMTEQSDVPPSLDALGSNLSLVGSMDTMRIDIVVSEHHAKTKATAAASKAKRSCAPPEDASAAAFVCERIGVDIEIDRKTDMAVNDMIRTRNVLYVSRGQLKNHTSTVINFNVGVRFISQRVNMPLLRLLHQISNMYQNVKDTQNELREQQPVEMRAPPKTSASSDRAHSVSDLHVTLTQEPLSLKISDDHHHHHHHHHHHQQKPVVSPSPSVRSRPQSFAQKLRSTGKSVKGYMNLSEGGGGGGGGTPVTLSSPSGSAIENITNVTLSSDRSVVGSSGGRCWKTMYHVLELYANMPDNKTIKHRFSVGEVSEAAAAGADTPPVLERGVSNVREHTKLIVFGVARIHRTKLLATLSVLKLEAEITSLHASLTCRKKSQPAQSLECSLTGQVGRTMIVLLEGVAPSLQTVVRVTVGKSQTLYSSVSRRAKDKNNGLLTVGAVNIDIPQHPVALHGMVTRGSKQLSSTLQELRVTRTSSRLSRPPAEHHQQQVEHVGPPQSPKRPPAFARQEKAAEKSLLQPLVMQFSVILQSLSVTAALLPSLQAQYKMDHVSSAGVTGSRAKFTIDLRQHTLSFTTKLQVAEANLPSEASIALPAVHVAAEYIPDGANAPHIGPAAAAADGVVFMRGGYLNAHADIGVFEHSLTTDLLNHLVFVQKVFMKEVNEVVQKVYGGERPVAIWEEEGGGGGGGGALLFSLVIQMQRVQLTATTAGNSAVRLETGAVVLELSNRIENAKRAQQAQPHASRLFGKAQVDVNLSLGQLHRNVVFEEADTEYQQFAFFNTRIGCRNAFQDEMVGEAAGGDDKEVVLITLKRPLIYIQPVAVDKAILVWLNYKNAYDYWNEKRANLNKEVLTATSTQHVFEKKPQVNSSSSSGSSSSTSGASPLSPPHLATLFLQLTVEDMGICLPLNPLPLPWYQRQAGSGLYEDTRGAVVITLENTSISACSSGSLVSKGKFSNLCLRFAEDFETSLDDWKPDMTDAAIMNLCVVSDGTYEVCSRTIAARRADNAKWFLNVQWKMEGVDIHLDTNVGKQLSALGHTLTMLTGADEDAGAAHVDYDSDELEEGGAGGGGGGGSVGCSGSEDRTRASQESILPAILFDTTLSNKERLRLLEKEMNEQAKIINDFRDLGASQSTIEAEVKKLRKLEAMVYKDFRMDIIQRLRRQSLKASAMKGKLLGAKSNRSRSFVAPMPESAPHDVDPHSPAGSFESSPRSGPSRSASLRAREHHVTFCEERQYSLQSAASDLSLPDFGEHHHHVDADSGETVQLRRKPNSYEFGEGAALMDNLLGSSAGNANAAMLPSSTPLSKQPEPNIDLELDVKVFINSGKCVLHTKDAARDEELKSRTMRKDRSCSAGLLDFSTTATCGSPDPARKTAAHKEKLLNQSSARLRNTTPHATHVDLTIFHIPGLDVKLLYQSKVAVLESPSSATGASSQQDAFLSRCRSEEQRIELAFKRQESYPPLAHSFDAAADMRNSTSLHGIANPNYTPTSSSSRNSLDYAHVSLSETSAGARQIWAGAPGQQRKQQSVKKASLFAWMTLQSVPEETIISPHILEFLEQTLEPIPAKSNFSSLGANAAAVATTDEASHYGNYVYTSFPVDVIVYFHMQPSTFRFSCLPTSRVECMLQLPSLDIVFSSKRAEEELLQSEFGEATPTAVGGLSVTGCLSDFSVYIFHPYGGKKSALKEAQWSPLADSERKDSLSVNVEFVKFHLSRSRMLDLKLVPEAKGRDRNVIRFSTITDIGSASFKYDMRRLAEILAFPKAWYRRSIVRRMFLGDLSMGNAHADDEGASLGGGRSPNTKRSMEKSPNLNSKDKLKLQLKHGGRSVSQESQATPTSPRSAGNHTAWETLVLFAVNFKKLNVHMNMGNVMGNVSWLTKDFRSEGRLSIGSTGHKNLYIAIGLGGSGLDAKGGIVGGNIEIAQIDTFVHIREEPNLEPDHTVGLKLHALELRLDYMATSVLMSRVSDLKVNLRDEWCLNRSASALPTRRPASIFIHGDLSWDQLQIMMSKSSTADLLKMFTKLDEFFSQQFNSSKRAFSGFSAPKATPQKTRDAAAACDARHHRHWQRVLAHVCGLQLSTLHFPLPSCGTVLGGTMELHGTNISLACFHGINFKSKHWALFSLREPCITFNTEAQEIPADDVHIVQTLACSLGLSTYKTQLPSMATVCKVSRNVLFPPQFKTLQEWFHYAFANSSIDEVDRFPSLEREKDNNSIERTTGRASASSNQKMQEPNHAREVIFALPSLQLHLKTEHLQTARTPDEHADKPLVECSFITEFEDHIFVTVDAEAFFFLHDLITSYVREKDKLMGTATSRLSGSEKSGGRKLEMVDVDMFSKDWRSYNCKSWHLEPTVRLLCVAGTYLEPYGVDYILQKLGFSHARTTIPKWMQRGFMDPLDAILAVLTLRMVQVVKGDGNRSERERDKEKERQLAVMGK